MLKIPKYIFVFLFLLPFIAEGQYFNNVNKWKSRRKEYSFGAGFANYIGDLGGLNREGINWFLFDLEFSQFKRSFYGSYRYNFTQHHASTLWLFYGKVTGSDQLTGEQYRNYRNLSFSSIILELAWVYEYFIIRTEPGHIYRIKGARGDKGQRWDWNVFAGVGGFYFNPKAHGVSLRYVGTEGQGLPGERPFYSPVAVSFPIGTGGSYHFSKAWKAGMDISYRFTTTDYLDDVSRDYYDNDKIRQARGATAAFLADPSDGSNPGWTAEGEKRGDPKFRDGFISIMFRVTYMPKKTPKSPYQRQGGKHPFMKGNKKLRLN